MSESTVCSGKKKFSISAENCLEQTECNSVESAVHSRGFLQGLVKGGMENSITQVIVLFKWLMYI